MQVRLRASKKHMYTIIAVANMWKFSWTGQPTANHCLFTLATG